MSSFADDHIAANKLFVETVQILQQAAAAKPSKALGLYVQVEDVSEVLVGYALRGYESPRTLQPDRVTS